MAKKEKIDIEEWLIAADNEIAKQILIESKKAFFYDPAEREKSLQAYFFREAVRKIKEKNEASE
ncbi:MAG: hypothetical protein EPO20_30600 [Betaproteobacteria bacterium]|nr:MAG: hypothetical protein EPO20_30600 [Betaproteobacteria bacterium]